MKKFGCRSNKDTKKDDVAYLHIRSGLHERNKSAIDRRVGQLDFQPYIVIWESELKFISGLSAKWGEIETGGELYGLFTHAGRPVIMLATPPGTNAIHQVAHFRQCNDFFKHVNTLLIDEYGLQYIGNFHSHHELGINGLSPGDIHSTHLIASKNGYGRFCQIVVTFERTSRANLHRPAHDEVGHVERTPKYMAEKRGLAYPDSGALSAEIAEAARVRIHSFIYLDATDGDPVRCPLKIITGKNPFRYALEKNQPIPELGKRFKFPEVKIFCDLLEPRPEIINAEPELPPRIYEQMVYLPEAVIQDTRLKFVEGLIFLSFPIPSKEYLLTVIYNDTPPHRVEAVYLTPNVGSDSPIELTRKALSCGPYTRLDIILDKIETIGVENNFAEEGDSSINLDKDHGSSKNQTNTPGEVYKKENDWSSEPFCGEGI
jgi:hypothetical protein